MLRFICIPQRTNVSYLIILYTNIARLDNRFGNSVACLEHLFSGLVFSVCTVSVIYIHGFAALFAFVSLLELNTALNGAGPKQLLMSDFVKVLISFTASTS